MIEKIEGVHTSKRVSDECGNSYMVSQISPSLPIHYGEATGIKIEGEDFYVTYPDKP